MKMHGFRAALGAALLLVCGAGAVRAQNLLPAKWNVPFSFAVGKAILPPGEYLLRSSDSANTWSFLQMQSQDGSHSAYFRVFPSWDGKVSENSKLVFHQYENKYFLAQICIKGEETGRELPMTKAEREAAKDLKRDNVSQAKTVTLVAENQQSKSPSQF